MISMVLNLYACAVRILERLSPIILPTMARFVFAAVLLSYFWASGLTKFDGSPFVLSDSSYYQIFPLAIEAAGYDPGNLSIFHSLIIFLGSYAEMVLPALIVLGLMTRLAAAGMIGFVIVQSVTDLYGHGVDVTAIGAWFDRTSDSLILDQRTLWVGNFFILVFMGGGPISLDKLLSRFCAQKSKAKF